MVAQNTLRKYEVNQVFGFVKASGYIDREVKSEKKNFFLYAGATCSELPSNISKMIVEIFYVFGVNTSRIYLMYKK